MWEKVTENFERTVVKENQERILKTNTYNLKFSYIISLLFK